MHRNHTDAGPRLTTLSVAECVELLERVRFGRVGFVEDGRAIVLPVNYVFDAPFVVFRSTAGSKLDAAVAERELSFEIDATDPTYHGGWSVLVHGPAEVVEDPEEIERMESLPLRSWWSGAQDRWLRIRVEGISGRRLREPGRGP
jgi:nitroimidazol reductase NimA-like FMN-containing flavoprotein (pyridoxamine 5'-phosphate oxidase superfamily)